MRQDIVLAASANHKGGLDLKAVIDRWEGEYAVLDIQGKIANIKKDQIPPDAREGDVLVKKHGQWMVDRKSSEKIKQETDHLADELWED